LTIQELSGECIKSFKNIIFDDEQVMQDIDIHCKNEYNLTM